MARARPSAQKAQDHEARLNIQHQVSGSKQVQNIIVREALAVESDKQHICWSC